MKNSFRKSRSRINSAINAHKVRAATAVLRVLSAKPSHNGVLSMFDFNRFFERSRLRCHLIIAESDLRKASAFGRALQTRPLVGTQFNTRNSRELALTAAANDIRQLNLKIHQLNMQLRQLELQVPA